MGIEEGLVVGVMVGWVMGRDLWWVMGGVVWALLTAPSSVSPGGRVRHAAAHRAAQAAAGPRRNVRQRQGAQLEAHPRHRLRGSHGKGANPNGRRADVAGRRCIQYRSETKPN